ncbi:MAG: orotidine 5'-phosphate decarboxylase / HUMPS family protein, partial [Nanobdellota archaeon]
YDGLDGIVCPASMAGGLEKRFGHELLYVNPGIKMGGIANKGQKQLYEPADAVRDCSNSILIIGTAITKADSMEAQAERALEQMTKASLSLPYQK